MNTVGVLERTGSSPVEKDHQASVEEPHGQITTLVPHLDGTGIRALKRQVNSRGVRGLSSLKNMKTLFLEALNLSMVKLRQ